MNIEVDIVPLTRVINPDYLYEYSFESYGLKGVLVKKRDGFMPIIIKNAPLASIKRWLERRARVMVRRTIYPFERIELEILEVLEVPEQGDLLLPPDFESLKQLYHELRSKFYQSLIPQEYRAELELAKAELKSARDDMETAKKEWMRTWRCSVCGASIVELTISAPSHDPDAEHALYTYDTYFGGYSCERLESIKRKQLSTYLFPKMTKADWDEIHQMIEAHRDFKIVDDIDAKMRYEKLKKRVEELERRVKELERRIEDHLELYAFLKEELKRDIQAVAKAIVEYARRHGIKLFDHFGEYTNRLLCDSEGFIV
jgi:HAMP domain-containing protein